MMTKSYSLLFETYTGQLIYNNYAKGQPTYMARGQSMAPDTARKKTVAKPETLLQIILVINVNPTQGSSMITSSIQYS